jgi:hypothetical protein
MTQIVILASETEKLSTITIEEAEQLDTIIIGSAKILQEKMLEMDKSGGYKLLGYLDWGAYLQHVAEDGAGIGVKALRRVHKSALLTSGAGIEAGIIKESSVRPIIDTLSDRKGYTEDDRQQAFDLAIEHADGDAQQVTAKIAQSAAWYVAVTDTTPSDTSLVERMRSGQISPGDAFKISLLSQSQAAEGIEHLLLATGDPELAAMLLNLKLSGSSQFADLQESMESSGYLPSANGKQVKVEDATVTHLVDYLNEPQKQKRYEKAVEKTEALRLVAQVAGSLCAKYWGIHPEVPENLKGLPIESELYQLLLDLGYIRYGAVEV